MKTFTTRDKSRRAVISRSALQACEPLESRRLFSAGFMFTAGNFGPHGSGGTIERITPSGLNSQGFEFGVSPAPVGLVLTGANLFVLSGDGSAPGEPTTLGEIGEYTTAGATINANLIPNLDGASGLAVAGGNIFVTVGNKVAEYTTAGVLVNADLIPGLNSPTAITISGTDLFVESDVSGNGTIGQYTLAGSAVNPSLIAGIDETTDTFHSVAVVGSNIFVLTSTGVAE